MNKAKYNYKMVPLSQIHQDNDQPRKDIGNENDRAKLKVQQIIDEMDYELRSAELIHNGK